MNKTPVNDVEEVVGGGGGPGRGVQGGGVREGGHRKWAFPDRRVRPISSALLVRVFHGRPVAADDAAVAVVVGGVVGVVVDVVVVVRGNPNRFRRNPVNSAPPLNRPRLNTRDPLKLHGLQPKRN